MTRLVHEAKEQLHAAVRESAAEVVSAEIRPLVASLQQQIQEAAERSVSIRRLGSEGQQVMPLDTALAALAQEAVPPDVARMKKAA